MSAVDLPFTKMHGLRNDYVVVSADDVRASGTGDEPASLARRACDRRAGIGADGLLLVLPSREADVRMRMFNVDGSEAEMCGNGLRCLVKYAWERGLVPDRPEGVAETGAGLLPYRVRTEPRSGSERDEVVEVTVTMGRPGLARSDLPMRGPEGEVRDEPLDVGDLVLEVTGVSMGNPHVVTWVDDVARHPVAEVGPRVEHHASFPNRTNTEFVEVLSRGEVRQRTWERGCGETAACGTGACAVAVAGVLTGRTDRELLVHLDGGDLHVTYGEDGLVHMRGTAVEVFEGRWPLDVAVA